MSRIESYAPGQFSWVDLMTPDVAAARRFYGELLGWTCDQVGDEQSGAYHQFYCDGANVAGMGEMSPEMQQSGMPPVWNSYVTVEDLDAAMARAQELGATPMMPRHEIRVGGERVGTMGIFADPEGAPISLWQAGNHAGAEVVNDPGAFAWNELMTRDLEGAKRFYGELFGWTFVDSVAGDDGTYCEIRNGERANGGILPIEAMMGDVPPHWGVYFSVRDCDASLEQIKKLGGQVHMPPVDIEPGRFAAVQDDRGANFSVIALSNPE